jgi:uncharacterized protein
VLEVVLYLSLGLMTGTLSGLVGIGGGVLLTPALIYLFSFPQHSAQGTTLAVLVPPAALLAAMTYYQKGFVNWKVAILIFIGFFIGGWIGANFAINIPQVWLKRIFGGVIYVIGLKMMLGK